MPRRRVEPAPDRLTAILSPPPAEHEPLDDEWGSPFPGSPTAGTASPAESAPERRAARVFQVPRALAGAVTRPAWLALVGVAVLCVVVACVVGVRTVRAVAAAAPTVVGPVSPGSRSSTPDGLLRRSTGPASAPMTGGASEAGTGTASAGASGTVVIHVVGLVARPGVVRLPSGSRVIDAVTAAGGTRRGADVAQVNLARQLTDGEQIVLPAVGAPPPAAALSTSGAPGTGGQSGSSAGPGTSGLAGPAGRQGGAGGGGAQGGSSVSDGVNLNTADLAALESLPGVGPVLAGRIVEWRVAHGRFTSVDELIEVPGIGERLLERIRSAARV